jgi:iron complex outermembrane receptor protein
MAGNYSMAQDKASDLDPVTVTTSLTPEKNSQTGRNLFVIRGERINALPVHSIDELLRYLPGIEVQSRGPFGAQSDIVLRGGTFQQVLVILDGVRLNDPNTGHFTSYIPISPSEIDRIEILKGASSAVYGSEAVGGVIQIVTKTFAARQGVAQSKLSAQVTGGQHDLFSADAGGFYSNGKTSVSAGILSNNTSGQQQRGTHGSVYSNTASASLAHFFNDHWQLQLRTAYDDRRFAAQNFYTNFISDTASEHVSTFWNQLGLVYHAAKQRVSLNVGYKTLQDDYSFNSISIPNSNKSKLLQALLTDEWKLSTQTNIVSGAQVVSKKIASNDRGDHEVDQAAAFIILNQQWNNRFFLRPALRVEWNELSGWELVPQINVSYRVAQWQLRGSAGKTIRDADFTERYNNYRKSFVSSGRIGNPNLEAERSFSYEGGADYFIGQDWKLSGTFFQRYHSKLIDYVPTPYSQMPRQVNLSPTGTYALAKNISKVTTTGAELEAQYTRTWASHKELWATAGLTWLNSKSSEATPSFYISSHAKFLATFNVQYTAGRVLFSVDGLYKKRQAQPVTPGIAKVSADYWVLNAKVEGFLIPRRLSIFAEADNIFDRSYADLLGAQMPGRWLMGGLKISLSK